MDLEISPELQKMVCKTLATCRPSDCFILAITGFELFKGAHCAPLEDRENEHAKVTHFVACLKILPFDSECARLAAHLNATLLDQGPPVSVTGVLIAATGLRHQSTVVTNNTKNYRRKDGFNLEDWR